MSQSSEQLCLRRRTVCAIFCCAISAAFTNAFDASNGIQAEHRTSYFLMPPFNRYAKSAPKTPSAASGSTVAERLLCVEESARDAATSDEALYVNRVSGRVYRCGAASPDGARTTESDEHEAPGKRRTEYDFIRFGRSAPPFRDAVVAAAVTANADGREPETPRIHKNKKASGQTYDYIRFGKRTFGYDRL